MPGWHHSLSSSVQARSSFLHKKISECVCVCGPLNGKTPLIMTHRQGSQALARQVSTSNTRQTYRSDIR